MMTAEQIVAYYERVHKDDMFNFVAEAMIHYLPYDLARPYLKLECTPEHWAEIMTPLSEAAVLDEMRAYMAFAWGKVEDHRGISASRSVEKMTTWLTILEDTELAEFAQDIDNYPQYGAPILKRICEKYGFPIPQGEWLARMARGLPCYPGCDQGCGE